MLGIKEISDVDRYKGGLRAHSFSIPAFLTPEECETPLADKLSLPVKEESEKVEVVWQTK